MFYYIGAGICLGIFTIIYFYIQLRRVSVFDKYIDMSVSYTFTDSPSSHQSRHGMLLFKINHVEGDFKAIYIDTVTVKSSKIKLRTYNRLYTKLPVSYQGITRSIGFKAYRKLKPQELDNTKVIIEGLLVDSNGNNLKYKKGLLIIPEVGFLSTQITI